MRPLVVVTVGTDHHPFHRLVDWLDVWLRSYVVGQTPDCFLQYGSSHPLAGVRCRPSVPHYVLEEMLVSAACVVTHAGPGCVMEARHHGHVPIVVPRQRRLGEHVDDHQLAFAQAASAAGLARVPANQKEFLSLLNQAVAGDPTFRVVPQPLIDLATVERFGELVAHLDPALPLLTLARVK